MPMMVVDDKTMKVLDRLMQMPVNMRLRAFPTLVRMVVMRAMLMRMKMIHFVMHMR
jgi:hypothetical protein